jgi:Domain of unknown function (DUF4232)
MRFTRVLVTISTAATAPALLATPQAIAATPAAPSAAAGAPAFQPCKGAVLHVALGLREGAAGTTYQTVRFRNGGNRACTVKGYPNTSFRTAKGKLVGPPSRHRNISGVPIHRLTVQPGGFVHTAIGIPDPGNFPPSTCKPHQTRKLRVTPPHRAVATVFAYKTMVCTIGDGTTFVGPLRKGKSPQ